ncbi:MAG: [Bacteroidales bacterium]|nr:[FeFe] hydrogenase H-cluster radical SAM maturase HydE [Bacteroidales bacterium]
MIDTLKNTRNLPDSALQELLESTDAALAQRLKDTAREVCLKVKGPEVLIRGLIEWSNVCRNDCLYCGIRRSREGVVRYTLTPEQILQCCDRAWNDGVPTFVLQGGENPAAAKSLIPTVREIRERYPSAAITLSLGELPFELYAALKEAGANRYLLRHETANPEHYASLHPAGMHLESRLACIRELKRLGYETGMGMMVGSPGQTTRNLVEDLRLMQEVSPHMIGIGPFIPQEGTPFENYPAGSAETTLRLLAIMRLMFPEANIPATTALATLLPGGKQIGILAGANVIMNVYTPITERKKYDLYKGKTDV